MTLHGRRARLLVEYDKLLKLEKRSDFIKIEPINMIEGMPPEVYLITFTCRGIGGINPDQSPCFSDFHQVSMKLSSNFPNQEPFLKWLTPIWHPNIDHNEPNHVCTNNVENWYATKSLDDLVIVLGEMVQYQRYHAAWTKPFPLDKEAAEWVINYAEPNGLVGPEKPVDIRQIVRPQKTRIRGASAPLPIPKPSGKLKLGIKKPASSINSGQLYNPFITSEREARPDDQSAKATAAAGGHHSQEAGSEKSKPRGITLGLRTKKVKCIKCYEDFSVPAGTLDDEILYFCKNCQG